MKTLMTVPIAVTLESGQVAIMRFFVVGRGNLLPAGAQWHATEPGVWVREPTDAVVIEEVLRAFPLADDHGNPLPKATGWRRIAEADVPADRDYRDALVDRGIGSLEHDMARAREIHRGLLRHERAPKLAELDVAQLRAMEAGEDGAAIAREKQRLRDITAHPAIEAATSIEELRAITLKE